MSRPKRATPTAALSRDPGAPRGVGRGALPGRPRPPLPARALPALALLVAAMGCGDLPSEPPSDAALPSPTAVHQAPLPTGVVEVVDGRCTDEDCLDTCGPEGCMRVEVRCPELPDVSARIRVSGRGRSGTLVLLTGWLGTKLFGNALEEAVEVFLDRVDDMGLRTVEVGWDGDGVWGLPSNGSVRAGSKTLACRAGTLLKWIAGEQHERGAFLAQGHSGGASQIAFSLAYYGLERVLDGANLTAGPVPCPIAWGGVIVPHRNWECLGGPGEWNEKFEPLRSGDPDLSYPDTQLHFLIGEGEPDPTIAFSLEEHAEAVSAEVKTTSVIPNTGHEVFATPEGAEAQLGAIEAALAGS